MFQLEESVISSQESMYNSLTTEPEEHTFYSIKKLGEVYYSGFIPNQVSGLMIHASPDQIVYERAVYTFLDFLGDVGGLLDALKLIGASLISLIYGGSLSTFLLSQLFYSRPDKVMKDRFKGYSVP